MVRKRKTPYPDGRANNGGTRQPTTGKNYVNRSDLQAQPVRTVPGQEYGAAASQAAAQRAVPMAGSPAPPPAPTGGAPGGAPGGPVPGGFGDFMRPTDRPAEPVTHGAPLGAGPGPEAMQMASSGASSNDDAVDLAAFAPYLPALELMASMPNTSAAARNFVRRLRGALVSGGPNPTQPPVQ